MFQPRKSKVKEGFSDIPKAKKCKGHTCTIEGQICPKGVPGASGMSYLCQKDDKNKLKWNYCSSIYLDDDCNERPRTGNGLCSMGIGGPVGSGFTKEECMNIPDNQKTYEDKKKNVKLTTEQVDKFVYQPNKSDINSFYSEGIYTHCKPWIQGPGSLGRKKIDPIILLEYYLTILFYYCSLKYSMHSLG